MISWAGEGRGNDIFTGSVHQYTTFQVFREFPVEPLRKVPGAKLNEIALVSEINKGKIHYWKNNFIGDWHGHWIASYLPHLWRLYATEGKSKERRQNKVWKNLFIGKKMRLQIFIRHTWDSEVGYKMRKRNPDKPSRMQIETVVFKNKKWTKITQDIKTETRHKQSLLWFGVWDFICKLASKSSCLMLKVAHMENIMNDLSSAHFSGSSSKGMKVSHTSCHCSVKQTFQRLQAFFQTEGSLTRWDPGGSSESVGSLLPVDTLEYVQSLFKTRSFYKRWKLQLVHIRKGKGDPTSNPSRQILIHIDTSGKLLKRLLTCGWQLQQKPLDVSPKGNMVFENVIPWLVLWNKWLRLFRPQRRENTVWGNWLCWSYGHDEYL